MPRDNREVENTLRNKFAFASATTRSADHRWLQLHLPGLPPIITKFSHTREEIGENLWRKIAVQLRVLPNYLSGMIDCRNSRSDYYERVRTAPVPAWNHLMQGTATIPEPSSERRASKKRPRRRRR